jgi:hypothetical protein
VPFSLRRLRRILLAFDCWEDSSRGKGSHTMFFREIGNSTFSYPIPKGKKKGDEIKDCYVKGVRKKFKIVACGWSDRRRVFWPWLDWRRSDSDVLAATSLFADKIARHPGLIIRDAVRPQAGIQ